MDDTLQERRLTTILAADVVGYSALMNADEAATLAALKALRRDVIDPKTAQHRGRTIKLMGDGSLVEFTSVVDAVRYAVDLQHAISANQQDVPDERRIRFRIGVNAGDIMVEGDDVYGDGVNIAARIEALADPGGICLSRSVADHIRGKLDLDLTPMGEVEVKNIPDPLEVFRVEMNDTAQRLVRPVPEPAVRSTAPRPGRARIGLPVLIATLLLGAAAFSYAVFWLEPSKPPVVAVLPFQDSSTGDNNGLLSDPISDGVLAHLARYPELTVIARGSSFRFREADRDLREIGDQLGADYILEGSLHFNGSRITTNVALVDTDENSQVWSDRIEAEIDNLYAVIDKIGQRVAYQVEDYVGDVRVAEAASINADALLLNMRARKETMKGLSKEINQRVIDLNRQAVELYPDEEWGHLGMAFALRTQIRFGWADDPDAVLAEAVRHGEAAVRLGPENYSSHFALGRVRMQQGDQRRAIEAFETALTLNPSSADTMNALAQSHLYLGKNEVALEILERSEAISPLPTLVHSWVAAWVNWQAGDCEAADAAFRKMPATPPAAEKLQAVILTCLGDEAGARDAVDRFIDANPGWTIAKEADIHKGVWTYDPGRERWLENLTEAGMPAA